MRRLRSLFHPIIVFIGVQIAWIILMGIWINWYFKNNRKFTEFAQKLRPELFSTDFNWVVLVEGSILMVIILAGVYIIFVYWNKQAKLNRMQSNFVASVSHELKSPLASIQLYLETMKYHEVSPQDAKDFVEIMLIDTERLSGLIDNILEAGTADPKSIELKFLPVNMGPFILEVMESYKHRFEEKGCETKIDIIDSPVLNVDKRALRMVFNNIISNALRYSPAGSDFTLRMENNRRYCEIKFIDTGIGLEKKDMRNILKKFYRVQNHETENIEGAGLGLFIAKETVKNHKGKFKVDSPGRGKGSKFTVFLPLKFVPKNA